jgi:hypothetical protein
MKDQVAGEVHPVAMPHLTEMLKQVIEHRVPIYV